MCLFFFGLESIDKYHVFDVGYVKKDMVHQLFLHTHCLKNLPPFLLTPELPMVNGVQPPGKTCEADTWRWKRLEFKSRLDGAVDNW